MNRPDRETVLRLLRSQGHQVTLLNAELTEDVDGRPLGVDVTEHTATLMVSPEMLGWTWDELGVDPEDLRP